ncbi:sigma-70 family RNA polymerase sigma factor [Aquiluna sp.]|nr:sigma-70 family RNA polymerase sigma factor [Aquiluna sp.]
MEQLSAIDESMASFGLGDLDSEHGVILKDWSAQDFANIYVRFRPHLISHARKFLREETQAEEVVQDAFLYLMTSLPELDSELGVLRFLKWKTKMLCLDIIRSSQSGLNPNLVPLPDDIADEAQPLDAIERADDAAIISLALAKLSPRHREALVATVFEEKSHEEVAQQMGVGENAFRQLLFRARASFRQALVGEAEIKGKSIAEILTVAARKAASARNTVLVALLFMTTVAISPMLSSSIQMADQAEVVVAESAIPDHVTPAPAGAAPDSAETVATTEVSPDEAQTLETDNSVPTDSPNKGGANPSANDQEEASPSQISGEEVDTTLAREAFNGALDENLVISLASQSLRLSESNGQFTAANQAGLRANFAIDLNSEKVVQFLVIEFESDGQVWKAVPGNSLSVVEEEDGKTYVSHAATDFLVGDFSGEFDFVSTTESVFSRSGIKLDLVFGFNGEMLSSRVAILPKT